MLPLNASYQFEFSADQMSQDDSGTTLHARGNVQIRVTDASGQTSTIAGDDVQVKTERIDADMLRAITDLDAMGKSDQQYRDALLPNGDADLAQLQIQNDAANMRRLREIVKAYGWPGLRFAGAKGAQNAFLVLQHADTASQKEFIPLLRAAVATHDVRGAELAMLEDRLLVADGLPQLYGTQLKSIEPVALFPVADKKNLDRRRKSMGLQPIKDYLALFGNIPERGH